MHLSQPTLHNQRIAAYYCTCLIIKLCTILKSHACAINQCSDFVGRCLNRLKLRLFLQPAGQEEAAAAYTVNKELFENEYRRKANEHGKLRKECFEKADEARNKGDHATANDYVNQVKLFDNVDKVK